MARTQQVLVGVLASLVLASAMVPRSRRAMDDSPAMENSTKLIVCSAETICGWTVYELYTKRVDYFMKNDYCVCAENTECLSHDDDISIGAYVHRCRAPSASSTEPPSYS